MKIMRGPKKDQNDQVSPDLSEKSTQTEEVFQNDVQI